MIRNDLVLAVIDRALQDTRVRQRYNNLISTQTLPTGCRIWLGAISDRGHGRFWLGTTDDIDVVVIAHRFGYALHHGLAALQLSQAVCHQCDEPSCQEPTHLISGTIASNTAAWATRRHTIGNPLRDTRGPRDRAIALRDNALAGASILDAAAAGAPEIDQLQHPLFDL